MESGIWLRSIHSSDHAGVPFVTLRVLLEEKTHKQLKGVVPIRLVHTRNKTTPELQSFTNHVQTRLDTNTGPVLTPAYTDDINDALLLDAWLEHATLNLYDILYSAAKDLWGDAATNSQVHSTRSQH